MPKGWLPFSPGSYQFVSVQEALICIFKVCALLLRSLVVEQDNPAPYRSGFCSSEMKPMPVQKASKAGAVGTLPDGAVCAVIHVCWRV